MKIGLDLDGVIVDFDRGWIERYNDQHHPDRMDEPIKLDAIQRWNQLHVVANMASANAWWRWFQESGGFHSLPVYEGAISAIKAAAHAGIDIVLITSRPKWGRQATFELIETHGLNASIAGVTFTGEKENVHGIDQWVDDSPYVLDRLTLAHSPAQVTRIIRPWNDPEAYPYLLLDVLAAYPSFARYATDVLGI